MEASTTSARTTGTAFTSSPGAGGADVRQPAFLDRAQAWGVRALAVGTAAVAAVAGMASAAFGQAISNITQTGTQRPDGVYNSIANSGVVRTLTGGDPLGQDGQGPGPFLTTLFALQSLTPTAVQWEANYYNPTTGRMEYTWDRISIAAAAIRQGTTVQTSLAGGDFYLVGVRATQNGQYTLSDFQNPLFLHNLPLMGSTVSFNQDPSNAIGSVAVNGGRTDLYEYTVTNDGRLRSSWSADVPVQLFYGFFTNSLGGNQRSRFVTGDANPLMIEGAMTPQVNATYGFVVGGPLNTVNTGPTWSRVEAARSTSAVIPEAGTGALVATGLLAMAGAGAVTARAKRSSKE